MKLCYELMTVMRCVLDILFFKYYIGTMQIFLLYFTFKNAVAAIIY